MGMRGEAESIVRGVEDSPRVEAFEEGHSSPEW